MLPGHTVFTSRENFCVFLLTCVALGWLPIEFLRNSKMLFCGYPKTESKPSATAAEKYTYMRKVTQLCSFSRFTQLYSGCSTSPCTISKSSLCWSILKLPTQKTPLANLEDRLGADPAISQYEAQPKAKPSIKPTSRQPQNLLRGGTEGEGEAQKNDVAPFVKS